MNKEQFGNFIANERRQAGITQQMLADKLHVTDKAVSKWERGLCFPDLTLLEHLAESLDLTVTELMACKRQDQSLLGLQAAEKGTRSLLDLARVTLQRYRRQRWISAAALGVILIILVLSVFYVQKTSLRPVNVYHKQEISGNYYLYVEEGDHLLRLHCEDPAIYAAIVPQKNMYYCIGYHWNRFTYQGSVSDYVPDGNFAAEGGPMEAIGSSIAIDNLLGVDCVYQEHYRIYPDPERERCFLRTLRYYYTGNGTSYAHSDKHPDTYMLTVEDCRFALNEDFDDDGIVELVVLTKYDEEPYLVYDLADGQIISYIPENIPKSLQERLREAAVW